MPDPLGVRFGRAVETLPPGYFALVMASGIISTGMHLQGHGLLSLVLLAVCATAFCVLLALNAWRLVAYPRAVREDFKAPGRAFGFFTLVAGTNVLGMRLGAAGDFGATAILLVVAGTAWLVLGYVVPWTAVLSREERPVLATANGTWFILVVATQSVAAAAATLEPVVGAGRRELALLAVVCWSVGVFLYGAAAVFVALRLMLYHLAPADLNPAYWVAMGAVAITVLAGSRIVQMADAPTVDATRGLVAGLVVVFWAFATWLIPVLVAAGWWRHVRQRVPLGYEATLWSMVFPLGMYGVAGIYLGTADGLPLVHRVGAAELWVAFSVWVVVFVAMLAHLARTVLFSPRPFRVARSRWSA